MMLIGSYEAECKANAVATRAKFFPQKKAVVSRATVEMSIKRTATTPAPFQAADALLFSGKSPDEVISTVAAHYGVTVKDLEGLGKVGGIALARFESYFWLRVLFNFSYPEIGRLVGGKHYSGVSNGVRAHKARLEARGAL